MIPKIIYMCHKELKYIAYYSENWKKLNPEYEIKLYDDNLCKVFLLNKFGQLFVDIFNFIKDGPIKADFWRCCILYKYGGFYVDADIDPLVPIDSFLENNIDFISCISKNFNDLNFNPHFIGCYKNNKILKDCINYYINFYFENKMYIYWDWSIVKCFQEIMTRNKIIINKIEDIILNNDNLKFQFFVEEIPSKQNYNLNDYYCTYKNIIIFYNRYKTYDADKHIFSNISNTKNIKIIHQNDLIPETPFKYIKKLNNSMFALCK